MKIIFLATLFLGLNVFADMDCSKLTSQEYNSFQSLSERPGLGPLLSITFSAPDRASICQTDFCIPGHHTFKCDAKDGLVEIYSGGRKNSDGYYNSDLDVLIMHKNSSPTSTMLWMTRDTP